MILQILNNDNDDKEGVLSAVSAIFVPLVILQIVNFDVDDREGELFAGQGLSVNSGEGFAGTLGHLDSLRLSRGARRSE